MKKQKDFQDLFLEFVYSHTITRILLRPFIGSKFSVFTGKVMDSRISAVWAKICIKAWKIDMSEYKKEKYKSYNEFFTRRIQPRRRPIDINENVVISPADGLITCVKLNEDATLKIKHTEYNLKQIFKSKKAAEQFAGGVAVIIRLTVKNYHRYCYPISGVKTENLRINGKYHTVNPIANDFVPIYKENTREYTFIKNDLFGCVGQMEVGALCVGKIINYMQDGIIKKGEEKGRFEFGGSTVVLFFEKDKIKLKTEFCNQLNGIIEKEIPIKMGQKIGQAIE